MNYYLRFNTSDSLLNEKWDDTSIETVANLVVGDIIDFSHEKFSEKLEIDFNTVEFLISKRIFICDSDFENVGGVFHLFLQPVIN